MGEWFENQKTSNIFLSLRTSVRERWKQADYEALK